MDVAEVELTLRSAIGWHTAAVFGGQHPHAVSANEVAEVVPQTTGTASCGWSHIGRAKVGEPQSPIKGPTVRSEPP